MVAQDKAETSWPASPVFLIGFMGAGKTSVAEALHQHYGFSWVDTDALVEQDLNLPIVRIFEEQGEDAFRNAETKALVHAMSLPVQVISCGGGMVTRAENIDLMKDAGTIIYLKVGFQEAVQRVGNADNRPLFADMAQAEKLYHERCILYQQAADITLETDGCTVDEVAHMVGDVVLQG